MTSDSSQIDSPPLLGRIAAEQGLATEEEVEQVMRAWGELAEAEQTVDRLGRLLVEHGALTERQLERVRQMAEQRSSGQQIPGYKLLERLGEGAMARVFKAKQVSLDRTVAIKVLTRSKEDASFVDRFYAEGRAAAKLNHPNIVQAYDVGKAGQHHYFVMEYVAGHSVFDQLHQHGRYDEQEAVRIVTQIAEALAHAHRQGFMHRDVKPKNIMITEEGTAKLADMGLARQVSDKEAAEQEAGKAFGTPYYISPEQIRGKTDVDQRADIYGLGATFYHMLAGRVPFEGENPSQVMHQHLSQPLTPPDHVNPDLSAGVGEIVEVMLAKDPSQRYANCDDLLEDLQAVAEGSPPLHARQKYDVASLAALEETAEHPVPSAGRSSGGGLLSEPLLWIAIGSMVLNLVLLIALLAGA